MPSNQDKMSMRERQRQESLRQNRRRFLRKSVIVAAIVGLLGWRIAIFALNAKSDPPPYSGGPVHWHADVALFTCGRGRDDLRRLGSGQAHVGGAVLHTHGDGKIHVEGLIEKPEDIALGKFFDAMRLTFDRDRLLDYGGPSGKACESGAGSVKLLVNGKSNDQYRDYVFRDGDKIEIRYE